MVEGKLDRESRTRHSCQTWMLDDVSHHVKSMGSQVITRAGRRSLCEGAGLQQQGQGQGGRAGIERGLATPVDKPIPRSER